MKAFASESLGEGAAELRLCYIQNGHYGEVEIGNPDRPLAYRGVLADGVFREQIGRLLRKSIRDHGRFLAHFDALETPPPPRSSSNDDDTSANGDDNIVERVAYAFLLSQAFRSGALGSPPPAPPSDSAVLFATYHPLLVESHYSVLLCLLMLGDFDPLLRAFVRAATIVDGPEGYPFYPPTWSSSRLSRGLRAVGSSVASPILVRALSPGAGIATRPTARYPSIHPGTHFLATSSLFSPLSCARQSASSPRAWEIVGPALAIDIFICLTFCLGSGTPPHRRRLQRPLFTAISILATRSIARGSSSLAVAERQRARRTECAREAEAHVFAFVDLDLDRLFRMRRWRGNFCK